LKIIKTEFKDLFIIENKVHKDLRGSFMELFRLDLLKKFVSYDFNFCQDNIVKSKKNVLRGLHYQNDQYSQSKFVNVSHGKIIDVAVDLRKNSNTYGKVFKIELSSENNLAVFIPKGFAHGYLSLSELNCVNYKVDNYYNSVNEKGIKFDDPYLNIDWGINSDKLIISEKDLGLSNYIW